MSPEEPRWSAGRVTGRIALTVAAMALVYLICRVAASALGPTLAASASALPPMDYRPQLKAVAGLATLTQSRVAKDLLPIAKTGAAKAPLAHEPFLVAAKAEEQAGRFGRAILLMEEARRRRPTETRIRLELMVYYIRSGRYTEALQNIDFALRRNQELRDPILPQLAKMLANAQGRRAIASILATEPEWQNDFLRVAGSQKVHPRDALDLYNKVRASRGLSYAEPEWQLVVESMIGAGEYRDARQLWLGRLSPRARRANAYVSSGGFDGASVLRPFHWDLKASDVGRADLAEGSPPYLNVSYYGGRDTTLAEQVLALTPGRYNLRLLARSETDVRSGNLEWQLICLPGGANLGALSMERIGRKWSRFATQFTVPQNGCPGQKLELKAEAGDVSGELTAQLAQLEIVP